MLLPGDPSISDEPIESLLDRRCSAFERTFKQDAIEESPVTVTEEGPIAIVHLGDPHLDDDGCDMPLLRHHIDVIRKTPGMMAACIGDVTNNWAGGLTRLWANQSTTSNEAWRLAEWLITSVEWAYFVLGNHDAWTGPGSGCLPYLMRETTIGASGPHDVRIRLDGPGWTSPVRIWARHSWPGISLWHPLHGQIRAAKIGGYPADLLVGGHIHTWGYHLEELPGGHVSHCIQVGSYKRIDDYSIALGHRPPENGACCVTIVDPRVEKGPGKVTVLWDIDSAASYLTYLRSR